MPPRLEPQLGMDEKAINDPDLEAVLERHLRAKDDVAEAKGVVKAALDEVNGHLAKVEFPPDTALRVGRFRLSKTHLAGGTVSFERKASDRITIGLVDVDGDATRRTSESKAKSVSDDEDLRPTGEVNTDALRGIADRSSEPTPIKRNGTQPPASLS